MNDLVSIVVPIYNSEAYLSECLFSLKNQTYNNIEVLMIDDGSTDNSSNICKEFLNDERFIYCYQNNSGVSSARNNGISKAHGNYIMFVDSDDYIDLETINKLLIAKTTETKIVVFGVKFEGNQKGVFPIMFDESELTSDDFVNELFLAKRMKGWLCNKLFSIDLLLNKQLNVGLKYLEDLEYIIRIAHNSKKFKVSFVNENFYHYRIYGDSSSARYKQIKIDNIELFHELIKDFNSYQAFYYRMAKDYLYEIDLIVDNDLTEYNELYKRNAVFLRKNKKRYYWYCSSGQKRKIFLIIHFKKIYIFLRRFRCKLKH